MDNIFICGLRADAVAELKQKGYNPRAYIDRSPVLAEIFKLIQGGFFSPNDPELFAPIVQSLTQYDPYLVCADFESYCQMQDEVSRIYLNRDEWIKRSIVNVAQSGFFSSDRTIREYAKDIWRVPAK